MSTVARSAYRAVPRLGSGRAGSPQPAADRVRLRHTDAFEQIERRPPVLPGRSRALGVQQHAAEPIVRKRFLVDVTDPVAELEC